jgi:precorrin-2 dehydrogenase/sirohydrochlorin ferrochelatase
MDWKVEVMSLYPIFLKLEGHKVLIVGGGLIAQQKIEAVLRSATDVTVIAPQITPRIRLWAHQGRLKHVALPYRSGMAQGYFLVIAATDSGPLNRAIYEEASNAGVLSNAVDDPGYCDFYAPAVVSRGDFQIAISTGGNSPALAQSVRQGLEQEFGPEYESWIAWLGRMREAIRSLLPRSERRKEMLRLLALCKPQKVLKSNQGESNGPLDEIGFGKPAEARVERASA